MLNLQLQSTTNVDTESFDSLAGITTAEGEFISMEDIPMTPENWDAGNASQPPNPNNRIFGFLVEGADSRNPKFNEVHVHLSYPVIEMENLYRTRSMMVDDAVLHVWFEVPMASFCASGISSFMQDCRCKVVSHIVQIDSLSMLATALMSDEIHSGPTSILVLSKCAEAAFGGVGQSLLDKTNNIEFMTNELKRYGTICVNAGVLTKNELADFTSNDRLLFMGPEDLSKRLQSVFPRRPAREQENKQ